MTTTDTAREGSGGLAPARHYEHLIGGRRRASDEVISRYAPGTGAVVAEVSAGGPAEVDDAVRAARAAFDGHGGWPDVTGIERAARRGLEQLDHLPERLRSLVPAVREQEHV